MKRSIIILLFIGLFTALACSDSNSSELDIKYFEGYTGTLKWGGMPAVDGTGLLFYTGNKTYGVPGDRSDYDHIFNKNENEADVRVDFILTEEKTVRGWGAIFNEIEITNIERLEKSLE